jgi:hypothetical protein
MPYTFTTSQDYGDIETASLTDTSTSLSGITVRFVYFRKSDGTYLVPSGTTTDYVVWAIGDNTLDVEDLLDKDYCLDITVKWFTGSSLTTSTTVLTLFSAYTELFLRNLTRYQASNPSLMSNGNFWNNKAKLRVLINDATQAVSYLNDQTVAQYCVNECKKMTDNPELFR